MDPQLPSLNWVKVLPNHKRHGRKEDCLHEKIRLKLYQADILELLQYSITVILNREFHMNPNLTEFNAGTAGKAAYFIRHNAYLGTNYLNFMNSKISRNVENYNEEEAKEEALQRFRKDIHQLKLHARQCHTGPGILCVRRAEQCNNAKEFILDPCVIFQLPWKSTLLHQWLLAAFSEVLVFERACYEFRYWPISEKYYHVAANLLNNCRDLKERIVYGVAVMSEMVNLYPEKDKRIPLLIRDQVILPSLPLLKFIFNGNACRLVLSLKKKLWSKSQSFNINGIIMDPYNYTMMTELQNYLQLIPYNFEIWINSEIFVPFPKPEFNIYELFTNNSATQNRNPNITKNNEDKYIKTKLSSLYKDEVRRQVTNIINKEIVLLKRLPGLTTERVSKFILDNQDKYKKYDIITNIVHEAMLYKYAYDLLIGYSETWHEANAFYQVMNLHLINMERNHLIKLTYLCGILFNVKPVAISVRGGPNLTVDDMNKLLVNDGPLTDYKSITDNLYAIVNAGVHDRVTFFTYVPKLRHKIALMIHKISCIPFDQMSNFDDLFFQQWDFIQYILPIYISFIKKDTLCVQDTLDSNDRTCEYPFLEIYSKHRALILEMISFYDRSLSKWIDGEDQEYNTVEMKRDFTETHFSLYANIRTRGTDFVNTFLISQLFKGPSFHTHQALRNVNNVLGYWSPECIFIDVNQDIFDRLIHKQHAFAYNHFNHLRQIAFNSWKVPSIEEVIEKYPEIGQMYFTYVALHEMLLAHEIFNFCTKNVLSAFKDFNDIHGFSIFRAFINAPYTLCFKWKSVIQNTLLINCVNKMKSVYNLLKTSLQKSNRLGTTIENFYDILPYYNEPRVRKAVDLYLGQNFDELDKMFPLLQVKDLSTICTLCSKESDEGTSYTPCPDCIKINFPFTHYYCSDECKIKSWNAAHGRNHRDIENPNTDSLMIEVFEED